MKILLFIIVGATLAPSLFFSQSPGNQTTGTIEGVVRDLQGNPVPQAALLAFDSRDKPRGAKTVADPSGKFAFRNLPPDTYTIYAFKESAGFPYSFFFFFATSGKERRKITVAEGQTVRDVVFELGPKHPTLHLTILNEQGPLSVEWEDSSMEREFGAREACTFLKQKDFAASGRAFDAAFEKA